MCVFDMWVGVLSGCVGLGGGVGVGGCWDGGVGGVGQHDDSASIG